MTYNPNIFIYFLNLQNLEKLSMFHRNMKHPYNYENNLKGLSQLNFNENINALVGYLMNL
jgi:hypothetical protein